MGNFLIIGLCIVGDLISTFWMIIAAFGNSKRFMKIAVAKDESYNATFGGDGNETISKRAARAQVRGDKWGCILCKILDKLDPDHCKKELP